MKAQIAEALQIAKKVASVLNVHHYHLRHAPTWLVGMVYNPANSRLVVKCRDGSQFVRLGVTLAEAQAIANHPMPGDYYNCVFIRETRSVLARQAPIPVNWCRIGNLG